MYGAVTEITVQPPVQQVAVRRQTSVYRPPRWNKTKRKREPESFGAGGDGASTSSVNMVLSFVLGLKWQRVRANRSVWKHWLAVFSVDEELASRMVEDRFSASAEVSPHVLLH